MSNNMTTNNNKYFTWDVAQLKQELKNRGLRTICKTKILQERLIFCDEIKIFSSCMLNTDEVFLTPDITEYRDINAKTKTPFISKDQIDRFLQRYDVHKDLGKEMYKNQDLLHARITENINSIFIQGHFLAQMKKSVQYKCDIQISKSAGFIDGTHCECVVGSGDTAHCKHIAMGK